MRLTLQQIVPEAGTRFCKRWAPGQSLRELALFLGLFEVALWRACGAVHGLYLAIAPPLMVFLIWRSRHRLQDGVSPENRIGQFSSSPGAAWAMSATITLVLAAGLLLIAAGLRCEGEQIRQFWLEKTTASFAQWVTAKGVTVTAQQLALHLFLCPVLVDLLRNRRVALGCAAAIFGLLHLPSLILVAITAIAAYAWSWCYQRSGRIIPLLISHCVLAILAHAILPERLNYNLRVGAAAREIAREYEFVSKPGMEELFRGLVSNRYFDACGATDEGFITAIYEDVLRRPTPPARSEVASWRRKLQSHCRADVIADILTSDEFASRNQEHVPALAVIQAVHRRIR